jgi:putative salt-induced outer membrane protein YdiY
LLAAPRTLAWNDNYHFEVWRKFVRKVKLIFFVVVLAFASAALADQITLKNGDRITGAIVKSDGKTVVIHTDAAGDVTVKFEAVATITTDKPLHVALKNGQTVNGTISTSDDKIDVATTSGKPVEAPKEEVVAIRNDADQLAYEKSLHPSLVDGWNGGAAVGFSLTRGNSQTENLSLAFNAARPTTTDKITLYTNAVYGTNQLATPSTTANTEMGGIRYDRNVNPRLFGFISADFMSNGLQDLNLRSVGTLGLGFHAIKKDTTTLDFLAGLNFTDENYTEMNSAVTPPVSFKVVHNFAALTLGEELTHKMGKASVLTEKLYFFPDLSQTGEYRGTFDLALVTKINKWFGWQSDVNDIYVSNPPPGTRQNDVVLTTGLNVTFTH